MVEQINMAEFKKSIKKLGEFLNDDTTKRVQVKLANQNQKVFSESHIQKVRSGRRYVKSVVDALIEVAKENRAAYENQLKQISSF